MRICYPFNLKEQPIQLNFRLILFYSCVIMTIFLALMQLRYMNTEHLFQSVKQSLLVLNTSTIRGDSKDGNKLFSNMSKCQHNSSINLSDCDNTIHIGSSNQIRDQLNFSNTSQEKLSSILDPFVSDNSLIRSKQLLNIDLKLYNKDKQFFKRRQPVDMINCRSVFEGNVSEIRRAEKISEYYHMPVISFEEYVNMTQNCEDFIKERGYITDSLTEEENDFPIAYSILMFKSLPQAERLLRSIYRPQNIYCIHIDAKSNLLLFQAMFGIASCFDNVFLSQRINVTWGQFSVLVPELLCMQELVKRNKKWKYFINLTGQEFPLKTNAELVAILKAYNGSNDVQSYITWDTEQLRRIKYAGKPPHDIIPMKGAVHVAITREFVNYILHDQIAFDLLKWGTNTTFTEELYFSSLIGNRFLNVPGGYSANRWQNITYASRFKMWSFEKHVCRGKFIRQICIFGIGDLPVLARQYELFANKFRMNYYPLAYDCLEELIYNRTRDEYFGKFKFDTTRYRDGGYVLQDERQTQLND